MNYNSTTNESILVVDDDILGLKLLNVILKKADYQVYLYQSANQALNDLPTLNPDMILLDIMMQEMDGYEFCTQVKNNAETKEIPVIFVTGKDEPKEIVRGFQVGGIDYITKPIKREELLARVRTHMTITKLQQQVQKHNQILQDSEGRFRSLFEYAPTGIIILNEEGKITLVNENCERMFGYSQAELLGKTIEYLIPERYQEKHILYAKAFREAPYPRKMKPDFISVIYGRCKDGTEIPVEIGLSYIKSADKFLYMAYISGISELVQAQAEQAILAEELKRTNEGLEVIVEKRTMQLQEAQDQLLIQQKLQQEVELAALIQKSLLPRKIPQFVNIQLAARALPASLVSGDIYDFFQPDADICQIVVADISGKGIPAALLASTARTLFRAETEHEDSPAKILKSINASLCDDLSHAEMFITYLVARLKPQERTLTYASAGHTESLWWRCQDQTCQVLPSTGPPIGVLEDLPITEETFYLRPGDIYLFYSDGLTEAANKEDELFGFERFSALITQNANSHPDDLINIIFNTVETFRGGAPRSDDLTLVVIKIQPQTINFTLPATMACVDEITRIIFDHTRVYGEDFAYQFELAASEIVTNIVQHAYAGLAGEIRANITLELDYVLLELFDNGTAYAPPTLAGPMPKEPKEGGYGIYIAHQITDNLEYIPHTPNGNQWKLMKRTM
ncbi:MAG: SpoIIE family protein phosphatase [Chloroflexota bacterium]